MNPFPVRFFSILVPAVPLLALKFQSSRRKENQEVVVHLIYRAGPWKPGTQYRARIRRCASRSDAAQAIPTPGAAFASGPRRLL